MSSRLFPSLCALFASLLTAPAPAQYIPNSPARPQSRFTISEPQSVEANTKAEQPLIPFPTETYAICQKPVLRKSKQGAQTLWCGTRPAHGLMQASILASGSNVIIFTGRFGSGIPVGNLHRFQKWNGVTFLGFLAGFDRGSGTTVFPSGIKEHGQYRNGHLFTGIRTQPTTYGQETSVRYENGSIVGETHDEQLVKLAAEHRRKEVDRAEAAVQSVTLATDGGKCSIRLPVKRYQVTKTEIEGRCRNGLYGGKATISFEPLSGFTDMPFTLIGTFDAGELVGEGTAKYHNNGMTFKGTFRAFEPFDGILETSLGNRQFEVSKWQQGQKTSSRVEERAPGFGEQLAASVLAGLATRAVDCTVGACAQARRQEQAMRQQQEQSQAASNSVGVYIPNAGGYVSGNGGYTSGSGGYVPDTGNNARSNGTGSSIPSQGYMPPEKPPFQANENQTVAQAPQQTSAAPTFEVGTNPPEFGGGTRPQGDPAVVTTSPPEVPAPQPAASELPSPIPGPQSPPPPVSVASGDQGIPPPIPGPVTNPQSVPAPVQSPRQNDTMGTGQQAPSYTFESVLSADEYALWQKLYHGEGFKGASPEAIANMKHSDPAGWQRVVEEGRARVGARTQASEPRVQQASGSVAGNSGNTNANTSEPTRTVSTASQTVSRPSTPTGLYPTNEGELLLPFNIGWRDDPNATYYVVAVHDLTNDTFPRNDIRVNSPPYNIAGLTLDHRYAWDVRACNQAGCSERSGNKEFKAKAAAYASPSSQSGSTQSNIARDTWSGIEQGTKECGLALVAATGESAQAVKELLTDAGGWRSLAQSTASGFWNIIRHPILSAQAAWNGMRGKANAVSNAIDAGNPREACLAAIDLSASVVDAADRTGSVKSLRNLKRVMNEPSRIADGAAASTPTGRPGSPLKVDGANVAKVINGRWYSAHALDQMQSDFILHVSVENAIKYGEKTLGNTPGTTAYFDRSNKVKVILNQNGGVVTATKQSK